MNLHEVQRSIYINVCMKSVACCHTCTHLVKQCTDNPFFACLHVRGLICADLYEKCLTSRKPLQYLCRQSQHVR